jgi:5-methylthioadenosine/S-adenosylhomocysteine deaminase
MSMRTRFVAVILSVLLVCTLSGRTQELKPYLLRGTLITPNDIVEKGGVLVSGNIIGEVGANIKAPPSVKTFEMDGFIYPGLIDLHNHITWNLFPRWKPNDYMPNRYQWLQLPAYAIALDTPHQELFAEGLACDTDRYGEVKAIVGGATSTVGTLAPARSGSDDNKCIIGLARNLDFYSGLYQRGQMNAEKLSYEVFPFQMSVDRAQQVRDALNSGRLTAFIIHVAEGKPTDASSVREFNLLKAQGYLRKGVSIIHGVALGPPQFAELKDAGVGLIWSPRSNIELYGVTTDVRSAKMAGVTMALAPDWSPSGSDGMLQELKYAATWNAGQHPSVFSDADLVKMATIYPAQLAALSNEIGSLSKGLRADLLVLRKSGTNGYWALLHASPADVRLVVIDGVPAYGDLELMHQLLPDKQIEPLVVCGSQKGLYFNVESGSKTWKQTAERLSTALGEWRLSLAPLTACP